MSDSKLSLMANSIPFSPVLGIAYGVCGALLIQQIHYLCQKMENLRDGHLWTYQTIYAWVEQIKVFEERSIKAKFKELRELGVVVTGNYNKHKYDRTVWYRLDYETLNYDLQEKGLIGQNASEASGKNCPMHLAGIALPIPKTYSKTSTETSLAFAAPTQRQPTLNPDTGEPDMALVKNGMKKGPTNVANVLAKVTSGGLNAGVKSTRLMTLYKLWATEVPRFHEEVKFVSKFTQKQNGMMTQLDKAWPESEYVLRFIIASWVKFGKHVAATMGVKAYPSIPTLEYLLKHKDLAMSLFMAASNPPEPSVQKPIIAITCTEPQNLQPEKPKPKGVIIIKKKPKPEAIAAPVAEPVAVESVEVSEELSKSNLFADLFK